MNRYKKEDQEKEILKQIDYILAERNFNKKNDIEKTEGLYVVTYRSKPIWGCVLELTSINPKLLKGEI